MGCSGSRLRETRLPMFGIRLLLITCVHANAFRPGTKWTHKHRLVTFPMVTGNWTHCVINSAEQPSNESQRVAVTEENICESDMLNPNRTLLGHSALLRAPHLTAHHGKGIIPFIPLIWHQKCYKLMKG